LIDPGLQELHSQIRWVVVYKKESPRVVRGLKNSPVFYWREPGLGGTAVTSIKSPAFVNPQNLIDYNDPAFAHLKHTHPPSPMTNDDPCLKIFQRDMSHLARDFGVKIAVYALIASSNRNYSSCRHDDDDDRPGCLCTEEDMCSILQTGNLEVAQAIFELKKSGLIWSDGRRLMCVKHVEKYMSEKPRFNT
jgi:hypothetical protein